MEEKTLADRSKRMRAFPSHKPQAWRWLNMEQYANKFLAKLLDKEKSFYLCPYLYTP